MATENNIASAYARRPPRHIKPQAPLSLTDQPRIPKPILGGRLRTTHKILPKIQAKNSIKPRIHNPLSSGLNRLPKDKIPSLLTSNPQYILGFFLNQKKLTKCSVD